MDHRCPDCGSPLEQTSTPGGRVLSCPACKGHLYGLSPFERMLAEGVGTRLWTASATGQAAAACPYCGAAMHRADGALMALPTGVPIGVTVCRKCQVVWVPDEAAGWVASHSSTEGQAVAAASATRPTECANCGAPYRPDDDGQCHWCHAQIAAPQPVVVLLQREPDPEPGWGLRLI
jgi:DNA-directed RNA polymerase subunit M/transcription elongation factor TFIIS